MTILTSQIWIKKEKDHDVSKKLGYNRFLVDNVWRVGHEGLSNGDIPNARSEAMARLTRKHILTKAMNKSSDDSIRITDALIKEDIDVYINLWKSFMAALFPDMYGSDSD